MPTLSTSIIQRFFNQGENEISQEYNLLVDRYSIATTIGVSTYTIPDYVKSIRRITYLGIKLNPLPKREFRNSFQPGTMQGRPYWYIYNDTGINQIQLYPIPNANIAQVVNVWDTDIPNGVIVEFFRLNDNTNFILPDYCRNYLLKKYVGKMIFTIDGPSQSTKLAQYFGKQWEFWKQNFYNHMNELRSSPRVLVVGDNNYSRNFPHSPILPISKFGQSVETGE